MGATLALLLATFVAMLGAVAMSPFLPAMAAELGTSVALLGQVSSLTMLLAAGLGLVIGPLADGYGHRRTLLVGLLTVVASALGTGLAPTYTLLLLVAAWISPVRRAASARSQPASW